MKKLIAMIGAVAMSFCAFADEPAAKLGISFEPGEAGVLDGTFTPSAGTGTWTWAPGDPLELGAYATDELTAAGVYGTGDKVRREELFPKGGDNGNYLKLDTGTAELTRGMDADAGTGCIDQLVKFTGFEEPQTNLTAGIGVWMSEFVTNDVDDAATTDLTETNLYVTVGQVVSGQNNKIALKIDGDYKLDQWYRLTIKPIGNIYNANADESRAGFVIYINGNPVASSDPRAYRLSEDDPANPQYLTGEAAKLMLAGQLFTAVVAGEANHSIVGYKGVGSIDDIILTNALPKFAITTVDVTFAPITGAIITKVVDSDGNEFDNPTGAISVKPGKLTVTLAAAPGYKMKGSGVYEVNTVTAVGGVLTVPVQEGDFAEVVATVTNGSGTVSYAEAELFAAFSALNDGDQVAIVKGCSVKNDEEEKLYTFTSNTTIDVAADAWDVFVGNYEKGESSAAGQIDVYESIASGKTLAVTFEDGAGGKLNLNNDVNGRLSVTNGSVSLKKNIALGVAAVVKAKSLVLTDRKSYTITLAGAAQVLTTVNTFTAEQIIPGDGELDITGPDADGYYTYQIKAAPAKNIVTITVGETTTPFSSTDDALAAVWLAEGAGTYPIVVTAIDDDGLTIIYEGQEARIVKDETITIAQAGSWAFSGALAYKGRIDGVVSATDVSIIAGGSITLGANGSVTVNDTTSLTKDSFLADSGYKVIEDRSVADKVTFKTEQVPVSDKPGISFEDGEAGVNGTTFNPSQASGIWTWAGDPLEIGAYDGETLPYGADTETTARRHALFLKGSDNANYLKLDTSTNELVRTMDNANGYVDQLMKFTGYEDIQTNFAANTKIAVWMGDICTNEETEATATNLYITVGRHYSSGTKQVALKVTGNYALDTWYRLTVKPIGNIYRTDDYSDDARAGFAVYINGVQVGSDDEIAKDLIEDKSYLTTEASTLMNAGKLFTAIDDTSTSFDKVAYNGIGAIDDIILTADKPAFIDGGADCTFTIAPPTGLYVVSVKNGNTELLPPYSVPAGTSVTITFGALPGWKITGNNSIQRTINTDGQEITLDEGEIEFATVAAIVVDSTGVMTNEYVEAELFTAFSALNDGDQVAIVKGCSVKNDEEEKLYTFTSNTTIDVAADAWDVFVGNYEKGESSAAGQIDVYESIASGKTLAVTFEDGAGGKLNLNNDVNGRLSVTNGSVSLKKNIALGVAAVVKAKSLVLTDRNKSYTITLAGAAQVLTTVNTFTEEEIIPGEGELEVSEQPDEDGYYTYKIAAAPGTFTVTVPELTEGLAFVAMTNGEEEVETPAAGSYTVNDGDTFTVVYAPAEGYVFTELDEDGVREATTTTMITPPEVALKVFEVEFADGEHSTINPPDGTSNLVWGTVITVTATAAEDYEFANESYEGWEKTSSTVLTTNVTVTAAATFIAPAATAIPVTVTLPTLPIDGVSSLVVSQKVNEVWEDVTATKLIGVGNEYVVVAIPAEGYTIENPIASGTAAVGTPITVTEEDVAAKVKINTYTVTVPELVNFTVAVTNGETEVGTTNGVYTFNYASNVKVAFAAAEGYEITKDTSTNIVSLVENVMIEAPTVAIKTFNVTFKPENGSADIVSNNVAYGTAFADVAPKNLEKTGYDFAGWDPEGEPVVSNTTYTAQWTIKKFNITFTDAAAWTNVVATDYNVVPQPTEQVPAVTGKSFKGWDKEVVAAVAEATYTAVYTNNQYTLTIPTVDHASAVVSNATQEVSERVFDYGTVVTVYWTAESGWKITSGATEQITMNGNVTANAPVVEKAAEPVVPGAPINCKDETEATKLAKDINDNPTVKAQYLKAPEGATVVAETYNSYFDAVANGTKVTFELNTTGEAALQTNANGEIIKIKPDKIAALTDGSKKMFEITVGDQLPGFYYAVKQGNGIGNMKIVEAGVLATGTAVVQLNFTKYNGAGFYKIVVSEKPIVPEN